MRDNAGVSSASLEELRAFVAVFDSGGFTAAAKRLGLTTNAVSLRVQKLEEGLGVRLFERTTRTVAPTGEARAFYDRVVRILGELEVAEEALRPAEGGLRGSVRMAIPGVVATDPFLGRLRALLDEHPGLLVQMRITNTPVNIVAEGVDLALVVGQVPESTFVGRLLGRATWVLAAAPAYLERHGRPRTPSDLAKHRCLRLLANPPQDEWTLLDRRGRQISVPVAGGLEADDSRTLGDATYSGLGIGVRPAGECARAEEDGRLERVLPEFRFQPLDVYALLPKGRLRLARVAACLEALRAAVRELA